MTTAAPLPLRLTDGQLPLFDGHRVQVLELALGGSIRLALREPGHKTIHDAAKLDTEVKMTIQVGDTAPFEISGRIGPKTTSRAIKDGATVTTTRAKIEADALPLVWVEG